MYKQVFLLALLFTMICLPLTSAETYFADITIDVDQNGFVTIDGITNYLSLLEKNTENYTSKKQSYWFLNITKEVNFTDFIYVLTLPESSSINYIKSSGSIRIEEMQGKIIVRGFGENEQLSIQVQYQIEKIAESEFAKFDFVFLILVAIIIILIAVLVGIFIKERNKSQELNEEGFNFKGLNQRQKQIMKLLIDNKTPLTQTDIQKMLNIPKAAVSRNIGALELKGLIEKEQIGMSNLIRIKKP
ncbi:MAG: hypothetical protein A3K77_06275 [Euryarchaeota archaeon RBG_13_31_8]|nr:MAG: hypothetical protein A3K77_06275 [Euryarchaeota archaeon RBG_13_31_8]